jgi:two-component system sensor histidine kinase AlgZ
MSRTPLRKTPGRARLADAPLRARPLGSDRARSAPLDGDSSDTDARPVRVWPASTRPAELNSRSFAPTHFDPLLDEKARDSARAAVALDVCSATLALRVVLGVQAVLAIGALVAAGSVGEWLARQSGAMYVGVAGTLLWLVTVCALKPALARRSTAARLGSLTALGAGSALIAWWPLWWLGLADAGQGLHLLGVALSGAALAGAAWAWLDLRARLKQPVQASVRLAELQSRIRPHFLFNALNTALALVRVDPAQAERVLEDLAQLFRVALADAGTSVSLDEEIELAQRYLAIEQLRFGRRLRVHWDIEPGVGRARVPPLMLQPLVENAVRHGVEPSPEGAEVRVRAFVRRGQAEVEVSNTLPAQAAVPGHGMAQHNVRERLRLLHDVAAHLDCRRDGALYRARIVLPL